MELHKYDFVSVAKVPVGTKVNYEYAPGREADARVNQKTLCEDGTYTLNLGRFGDIAGFLANDSLLVV